MSTTPLNFGREVGFATNGIQPPTAVYITSDDQLIIDIFNSKSPLRILVGARILLPDGSIRPNLWIVAPSTDRSQTRAVFALPEGFFLSYSLFASDSFPERGQTYVRLGLVRQNTWGSFPGQILFNGYLIGLGISGGPPAHVEAAQSGIGFARSIVGSVPGAGAEITETVPTNAMWRLMAVNFGLTTSATVATRVPHLLLDDGANVYFNGVSPSSQAASLAQNYQYADGNVPRTLVDGWVNSILPSRILMQAGHRIRTLTTAIAAGDQYTAPTYIVQEWISP